MTFNVATTKKGSEGFTLVELMVSLTIFTIVVIAAVSSLYTVNSAARRVEAMRSVLDNLNFAIESMSRTIRTGTDIGCNGFVGNDCAFGGSGGDALAVTSTLGTPATVTYNWSNSNGYGEIQKCISGQCVALTAPGIDVQDITFFVEGADPSDGVQPKVTMLIQGIATAGENTAPFAVQTTVSVRTIE